jgi:lipopolysaccharide heptosyltransferase I
MAKILIVRLGAMGDILHALPAVTSIRAALPEATIDWLVEQKWVELLTAQDAQCEPSAVCKQRPVVNSVRTVNTLRWRRQFLSGKTGAEIKQAIRAIRREHYDLAIDFQGAVKSALLASISGAKAKAGFVNPRESAARFFYSHTFPRHGEHVIEQNFGMAVEAIEKHFGKAQVQFAPPQLPLDPAAEAWAEAEIRRLGISGFAIMNPGAGWGAKQWPSQRFGEVAKALAVHGLKTLVNSAPGEEALAQELIQASGGNAFEIRCTIAQLMALTRRARLFMGGDTGPLHLAAALGIPCLGLFGPTDPARTGPYGSKSVALRSPESKTTFSHHREPEEGLLKISVEEAVSAARWLLGSNHG